MTSPQLPPRLRCCAHLFILALPGCLFGQVAAPAPASAAAVEDESVELSPFVVSSARDTGYTAANTLAGSRLNSQIADTPAAISVFTKDFLDDIGAINVNDSMEYALNGGNDLVEATGNNVVGNNFNYRIRGFTGSAARNFFPWGLSSDSFNIERLDFSRGPNSILFGVGSPGGIVNTSTKQANIGRPITQVQLRVASYDDYRSSLDLGRDLGKNVAVRLNLVWQDADGFRDWEKSKALRAAFAATWRVSKNTTLRFDSEYGDVKQVRVRPWSAYNAYQSWMDAGSPLAQTYGQSVTGTGTLGTRILYATQGVYANQPVRLINFRASNMGNVLGLNTPTNTLDETIHPRTANIMGPGGEVNFHYYTLGAFIEQRIGRDLFFEVAANRQFEDNENLQPINFGALRLRADANAFLPTFNSAGVQTGLVANPYAGKFFVEGQHRETFFTNTRDNVRATGSYRLDLGLYGVHRLAAMVQRDQQQRDSYTLWEANLSPNREMPSLRNANNEVHRITWLDLTGSGSGGARGAMHPRHNPLPKGPIVGGPYTLESGFYTRTISDTLNIIDTAMVATQSSFFKERLFVTTGWRRDHVRNYGSNEEFDPVTEVRLRANRDDIADVDQSGSTKTVGVVAHVASWLSVYANKSDNFQAQNSRLFGIEGDLPFAGNVNGKGQDAGLKFRTPNNFITGQVGWFETSEKNRYTSINGVYTMYLEAIWDAMGTIVDLNGGSTTARKSKGYELDLTANLTRSWRLSFNASQLQTRNSDLLPNIKEYLAVNRPTWVAAGTRLIDKVRFPSVPGAAPTIADTVGQLDTQIVRDTASEGQMPNRHREWNGNLFTNYSFNSGFLKGWSLGLGAQYRGDPVLGYNSLKKEHVMGEGYTLWNGMVSYSTKLKGGRSLRIQLNVNNLLDYDKLQVLDSSFDSATQSLSVVNSWLAPRTWSLTTTITF